MRHPLSPDTGRSAATSKTVAIMQPTYLGWAGYYAMLDQADVFILDDTSAVNVKSWQMRNRIRLKGGQVVWLSIPTNARRGMPLNHVQVVGNGWQRKHWRTIEQAYSKTPGWDMLEAAIAWAYAEPVTLLAGLTSYLIRDIAELLGITTPIVRASDLGPTRPDMHDRITDLCQAVNATVLLNTPTAKKYLDESMLDSIRIQWHDYTHPVYGQGGQEWQPHLSVLDLIAHCSKDSLEVIRGNPTGNLHSNP